MSPGKSLLVCLTALTLVSACRTAATDTDHAAAERLPPWQITLLASGGLRGIRQSITLSDNGRFSAADHRRDLTRTGRLSAQQLAGIEALLRKLPATPVAAADTLARRCADCVQYDLQLTLDGERTGWRVDPHDMQDSPHTALVEALVPAMRDALQ